MQDDSAEADNEGTMMFKRNDHSMANAGRKNSRLSQTAKKRKSSRRKGGQQAELVEDEALSAGEMDELD